MLRDADYLDMTLQGLHRGRPIVARRQVDVVVTDGFSGNIALKTAEGTARFVTDLLRRAFTSSLRSKAGFALSRPALHMLKVHLDPNNHNGAVFLGLNGLVVKSHGSANAQGHRQRHRGRRAHGPQRHHPPDRRGSRRVPRPRFRQRRRQMTVRSVIAGTGSALPARRVDNAELGGIVDTTDEWIVERTGIRSRYIAGEGETTATLAADACPRRARRMPGSSPRRSTSSCSPPRPPTRPFPSSATKVQAMLGIDDCIAFDVHAVCTGFLYALTVANSMLRSGSATTALVIGSETFSRILDWEDRGTCVLFGDGAGALVLKAEDGDRGILATKLHADGRHGDMLYVDGGPSTTGTVGKLRMKGREVFRHAVVNLADVLTEVLVEAGLDSSRGRLGRAAPGQCPNPRRDRPQIRPVDRTRSS